MIFDNKFLLPWRKRENDKNEDVNYNNYIFSFLSKIMNLYEIECDDIETPSYNILKYAFINEFFNNKGVDYTIIHINGYSLVVVETLSIYSKFSKHLPINSVGWLSNLFYF